MSFSADVKEEISKLSNLKNKENVKNEFIGYLTTANAVIKKSQIKYSTESEYNINRFAKLLNNLFIDYTIEIQGNLYVINFKNDNYEKLIETSEIEEYNEETVKSILRGSFLGSGSLNDPNKTYHLEMVFSNEENEAFISEVSRKVGIKLKKLKRKNSYALYIKEGEEISKFLAFIGAPTSVIKFEEIRVIRDMRNNVNRIVNCETANLNKTVNAAVRQIESIKYIKQKGMFDKLSENLQKIAEIRQDNPDASLIELGKMLKESIGKSGVNHRLKKIQKIADELRKNR